MTCSDASHILPTLVTTGVRDMGDRKLYFASGSRGMVALAVMAGESDRRRRFHVVTSAHPVKPQGESETPNQHTRFRPHMATREDLLPSLSDCFVHCEVFRDFTSIYRSLVLLHDRLFGLNVPLAVERN